ncbi:MAG: pre-toxin TG domain-containing protein, partial [Moraxellaceae bacterium]|nr:pre-toxin TG domain-containing protein [Moraxellaceae bacterium]
AAGRGLGLDGGNLWSGVARSVVTGSSPSYFNQQWARGGKLDFVQLAMDSFGNALGNDIVGRMTPAATAAPVTLAKNGQRAMDMDGVNFLDAGVDTSMPDMRWMDDLNTSIATGSNLAVNANTPGYTATVSAASQTAVAGGYDGDPGMGTFTEITYNTNEQVMPEVVVTASAKESGGGLLNWLRKPENISFVLDMVPVVGTLKSLYQAGAGRDLITGEAVNRWVEGAGIVAGMIPGGKLGVKGVANVVANTAGNTGKTVLGHFPEYKNLAESIGARRFNIPENVWNKMSEAERWGANQKFLDRMITRGDDIILSTPLDKVRPGSYFARELEYLGGKGYRPSADGSRLIRGD